MDTSALSQIQETPKMKEAEPTEQEQRINDYVSNLVQWIESTVKKTIKCKSTYFNRDPYSYYHCVSDDVLISKLQEHFPNYKITIDEDENITIDWS